MHLHSLATAVPPAALTQAECWQLISRSPARQRLNRRSRLVLQAILCGDSGIAKRHFAVSDLDRLFDFSADELNAAYRELAPALAAQALRQALPPGTSPRDLDALFVCTCTGYLCPGVSSYLAEQMGCRRDAFLLDVVGHGCGAAVPMLHLADNFLAANPGAKVATVAVEICSAAFYLDDDPGVLVSACLFADGAAAAVWGTRPGAGGVECLDFNSLHRPRHRDRLRFEQRGGKLRNLLDPAVPALAAESVVALTRGGAPSSRLIVHPGGRDVIEALETAAERPLPESRAILWQYGNMSSPSVLFVLAEALRVAPPFPGESWSLISFGAGFSVHGCHVIVRSPGGGPRRNARAPELAAIGTQAQSDGSMHRPEGDELHLSKG
ncbi:MAG TPA: 3-oxoacyl-[acyl-carrier-protein] synthase III C-terminal domain-containing protein [Lacunisphaera sp.]|nr:3-oxoacyl-[acyl-carrier-protein] synthase III C-terminal domain-containing protein [Lacunisphaera sp.]